MTTQTQITINDLAVIKNLIEVACTRGAFTAGEAKTVGEVYEKLNSFLDSILAQADQQGEVSND